MQLNNFNVFFFTSTASHRRKMFTATRYQQSVRYSFEPCVSWAYIYNAAIIEPSCSRNELIRLSSVQRQCEKIDAIIWHHEMLQSVAESVMHSDAAAAAAVAAARPETRATDCPIHLSLPLPLTHSPYISRFRPFVGRSERQSFHLPVPCYTDDTTSSSEHEKSIPCQLRGRASVSCERDTIA